MLRRSVIALIGVVVLAACDPTAPLVSDTSAPAFVVNEVRVSADALEGVVGRENDISTTQVAEDIRLGLEARLMQRPGDRPALMQVAIEEVVLTSPGRRLLPAARNSRVVATVAVNDTETGDVIVPPSRVVGRGEGISLPSVLAVVAAAMTRPVDEDYAATIAGFVRIVETRLYPESD